MLVTIRKSACGEMPRRAGILPVPVAMARSAIAATSVRGAFSVNGSNLLDRSRIDTDPAAQHSAQAKAIRTPTASPSAKRRRTGRRPVRTGAAS